MYIEVLDDGIAYLNVILSCIASVNEGKEVNSLRTVIEWGWKMG